MAACAPDISVAKVEHLEADSGTATTDGSSCDISVEVTTGKTKTLQLKSENSG